MFEAIFNAVATAQIVFQHAARVNEASKTQLTPLLRKKTLFEMPY